eukprot:TRINITY_DN42318_c0_g1_i1.p1 TRINITY_DN42318_c0_g1~~TRINITY_DN42318_c0_g1_i1.p1  ORF type:complete len:632 (-),score=151.42 TRINITY_DN42318_c0_g1_i1:84-1979(-)
MDDDDDDESIGGTPGPGAAPNVGGGFDSQALELTMAQMETRLRSAITELISPTVQRITVVISEVDTLKTLVHGHTKGLQDVQLGQLRSQEQVSTVHQFKEEMARWDTQRKAVEASLEEKVTQMQQKLDGFRYSLEQKESALHHMNRSLDRVVAEVNRLLEEYDGQRDVYELRIDEISKAVSKLKVENEVRVAALEQRHNALSDELWGDELGLAKVAGELKKTNATFGRLEDAVAALEEGKAEAVQLDKLRSEVAKMVHEAKTSTAEMQQAVGEVVNDVREHFRTASQTIAAHNANFVKEVREDYQAELANSAKLRSEVQSFMEGTSNSVALLEERVTGVGSKASALAAEAREELEELNRRRKRDKTASDNELKALKKRLGGVFDNSDAVLRGLEHLYAVISKVLESNLMACALEQQDSVDRERISLMGVKDDETTLARTTYSEPQRPRPECRVKSAPGGTKPPMGQTGGFQKGGGGHMSARGDKPVVRVDNRCVSCSGQAPLVLSAFKMACLHYAPSAVDYAGAFHERGDLLHRRHTMLQTAHEALFKGPAGGGLGLAGEKGTVREDQEAISGNLGEDKDSGRGDAFAGYAAIEARHTKKDGYNANAAAGSLRLPGLPAPGQPSPRAMTAR